MLTILTPMVGKETYSTTSQHSFPKILSDVKGKTLFEYSQQYLSSLDEATECIYLRPKSIGDHFKIDSIIYQVVGTQAKIIEVNDDTAGALCTCLLAADYLNQGGELIIISADQYLNINTQDVLQRYRAEGAEVGLLTFHSVHPKWAYVNRNDGGEIIEIVENKVISNEAMASFFYFKNSVDFLKAAQAAIIKADAASGCFYLSSCINEMVLVDAKVSSYMINKSDYCNFYDFNAISDFSNKL